MKIVFHIGFHTDVIKPSTRLRAQDFTSMPKNDVLGNLLYTTAISYYAEYDMMGQKQENEAKVVIARLPSEATFSVTMSLQNSTTQW